jgi:hypothetical protein
MTVIDLTEKLDDIRRRYPDWWKSEDAAHELRAAWANPGLDECNDCHVFISGETIRVNLDSQKSWYGEVRISVAPNGWHAVATSYWYGMGGGGYAPSVWSRTAYTTRDEAIEASIKELIAKFEGVRQQTHAPENQVACAKRMVETLKSYLSQNRQLTLL